MITTKTTTFFAEYNYGAALQAYALQQYLSANGVENEMVDIRGKYSIGYSPFFSHQFRIKNIIRNICTFFTLLKIISYRKKFKDFVEMHFKRTKMYYGSAEVEADPPQADCFICGSDQIWNITRVIEPHMFLSYVKSGKKISYAASFGVDYLDDYQADFVKRQLKDFDAISVREETGLDILRDLGIEGATRCIDPVFLQDKSFWQSFCAEHDKLTPKEKYILVYSLSSHPNLFKMIEKLRTGKNLKVVVVTPSGFTRIKKCKKIINASPIEFVNLIMNAEYVVSSSFHGMAFSVIFQKKFFAFANGTSGTRTSDFLDSAGLSENLITENTDIAVADNIDYIAANQKLAQFVQHSKDFLSEAIYG